MRFFWSCALWEVALVGISMTAAGGAMAMAQEAPSSMLGPYQQAPAPVIRQAPEESAQEPKADAPAVALPPPLATYDPALFQKPIPKDQLAFLNQFAGAPSNQLYRDKQFKKLMKDFVPDCTFHYGSDKSLNESLNEVIEGSNEPVIVRDGRYVMLGGHMGPFLAGRGFLWIDLQEGIGLGAFYFHPTNGEPTPSVNVFSRQIVNEVWLEMAQLPQAFAEDLDRWEHKDSVPPVTTRYFLTGSNKKILLEHDEDYCSPTSGVGYNDCDQMMLNAADLDMDAASYLEQTHHATNATAWMINGPDRVAFLEVRTSRCGILLACRITMTRERTHMIAHAPAPHPGPHPIHR
jgi:hypothetical protein